MHDLAVEDTAYGAGRFEELNMLSPGIAPELSEFLLRPNHDMIYMGAAVALSMRS
jgi:hypothetical protein